MTENKRSRCDSDDAKMSLVVRKNEKVCAVFIQKASLEHPPPDRTRGGDARCGPTSSQRQGAQLPVDPHHVCSRRRARLGAFPGGRHHRRCDEARSAVAMTGLRR